MNTKLKFIDRRGQIWEATGISNQQGARYLQHQPSGIGGYFQPAELDKLSPEPGPVAAKIKSAEKELKMRDS
jgi:hypothetical protein